MRTNVFDDWTYDIIEFEPTGFGIERRLKPSVLTPSNDMIIPEYLSSVGSWIKMAETNEKGMNTVRKECTFISEQAALDAFAKYKTERKEKDRKVLLGLPPKIKNRRIITDEGIPAFKLPRGS